jgi:hypothetical protein
MQQQKLDASAARFANTKQTRCDNARFVEHKHVAGTQETWQVAKSRVLDAIPIEHHQTAIVAPFGRMLSD